MLGGLNNKIKGGKKILSRTISVQTVESEIAKSLEDAQHKFKKVEIGSYPFFRLGKIGVSIVIRSTDKKKIDDCYKEIVSFLKRKKIKMVGKK
jgi:molybdopterin-biosynthesis enzyme MoeA-like protein